MLLVLFFGSCWQFLFCVLQSSQTAQGIIPLSGMVFGSVALGRPFGVSFWFVAVVMDRANFK